MSEPASGGAHPPWHEGWSPAPVPPYGSEAAHATVRNLTVELEQLRHVAFHLHGLVLGSMQDEMPVDGRSEVVRLVMDRYREAMGVTLNLLSSDEREAAQ